MAARKPEQSDPDRLVPFNFRIPEGLVTALDSWLDEQNKGRQSAPLNRSDLIRGVLAWASKTKPEWEEGQHVLVVVDGDGDVVLRQSVRRIAGSEIMFADDRGNQRTAHFAETRIEGGQVVAIYVTATVDAASELEAPRVHHLITMADKKRQGA